MSHHTQKSAPVNLGFEIIDADQSRSPLTGPERETFADTLDGALSDNGAAYESLGDIVL